jgi:hypothetical protein
MIHAFEQNEPTAIVDYRDDAAPLVALRLASAALTIFRATSRLSAFFQQLRLRALPQKNYHAERETAGNSVPHRPHSWI